MARSDWVMVAATTPFSARPVAPKKEKEEETTPVRRARLKGSVARWMSCWVRVSIGWVIVGVTAVRLGVERVEWEIGRT